MISLFRSLFAPPRHLVLLVVAVWVGMTLAEKRSERHGVAKENVNNLVYYSFLGYLLGGRLLYALANFSVFLQSPLSLISLNLDLFDPLAGLVTAVLVGLVYGSRRKLSLWSALDALTPLLAVLTVGLALSHLAAGTAFGSPTEAPWGIELWNATRHPTQIYELVAALLIFGWIWLWKPDPPPGRLFLTFAASTAAARLFLEAFRGDSTLVLGGLRLAQILAWVVLALALFASEWLRRVEKAG